MRSVLPKWVGARQLIACGLTTRGRLLFWNVISDDPDEWPVVIVDRPPHGHFDFHGGLEQLLVEAFTGALTCEYLPDGLNEHRYFEPF
jgi:hypothetical protein